MSAYHPEIDAYIERAAPFAQPILIHIRELVHRVCPDVEEKMKWSFPHFDYRGEMMFNMASFKQHCAFGFWKASLLNDPHGLLQPIGETGMGNFGKVKSMDELPPAGAIEGFLRQHMALNEQGVKLPRPPKKAPVLELDVPVDLMEALSANPAAHATFAAFSDSNKREYVTWIVEAKADATRARRLAQAIEWMAEGKIRNWKYVSR